MRQLMVQGTTSDAGKSFLVTALCRWARRQGWSVAPFKPQNMALNSAVTCDQGEIGRAQAVQAQACGIEPHTDMNPVLIKPNSDTDAQIIIHGQAIGNLNAVAYHDYKQTAMAAVLSAYQRLCDRYDVTIVEGAGSPAEINLRDNDIANMGFAEQVDCPVILVADIDRGGVFAHLVGTLALLSEQERQRVVGFVINRFRGDISLLQSGLDWLEKETGKPVLGVLPYLMHFHLEAEDAIPVDNIVSRPQALQVVVPVLPRISNHTDFDPLRLHPQVDLHFVGANQTIPPADLVILPGSKSVCADLQWLRQQGWDAYLQRHLRYGGKVLGICGGFQMLGQSVADPLAIESNSSTAQAASVAGFGLLDITTTLAAHKTLGQVTGHLWCDQAAIQGYEIHAGVSVGEGLKQPFAVLSDGHPDGAISGDGAVAGTYLHGCFDNAAASESLLRWAGLKQIQQFDYIELREKSIERLADMVETHLNTAILRDYIGEERACV